MKVQFSSLSAFKLEKLITYLKEEWTEKIAADFLNTFDSSIEQLQKFPTSGTTLQQDRSIRKLVVNKQTSVFYKIKRNTIYILNIVDNRQNPELVHQDILKHFGKQ